jgi:hypothetical protein
MSSESISVANAPKEANGCRTESTLSEAPSDSS